MYLLSLLFQGVIGVLLVVFIITVMVGVYSRLSNKDDQPDNSSNIDYKADKQVVIEKGISENIEFDEQTIDNKQSDDVKYAEQSIANKESNVYISYPEKAETKEILESEKNAIDTSYTEAEIQVEKSSKTDIIDLEQVIEEDSLSSLERQANSVDIDEIKVSSSSIRKSKKRKNTALNYRQ